MPFDTHRLINRRVVVRDVSGNEVEGVVKEVYANGYLIANGDGTQYLINGRNVTSLRVFP